MQLTSAEVAGARGHWTDSASAWTISCTVAVKGIDTLNGTEVDDLYFSDCELPADSVVGEVGQGWPQLMPGPATERLILAAQMLGVAERAFDDP